MKLGSPSAAFWALAFSTTSLSLASTFANAGEISLFESAGFGGRQVSLRSAAPSISNIGFNDRTSSIVVRAGRWEVCSDDDFRGECAIFEPGQYASLDGRFDKRVSSAREVAVVGATSAPAPIAPESIAAVQLYGEPNFGGRTMQLNQASDNFKGYGFNDRAASLVVQSGTWEFCTDANFRGTCRTFVPGRYPTLGAGMTRALSSARPVIQQAPSAAVHGGGWSGQRDAAGEAPIVLFARENARGRSLAIAGNVPDMTPANFNDVAQSAVIESGFWEFCSDSYYRGTCRVLGPGQFPRLDPALYRTISSVRAASREARPGPRPNRNGGEIELFTAPNFIGNRFLVRQDLASFNNGGYNDMIGSLIVNGGQWELCVDVNYGGGCTVFGPGRYSNLGGLTNQLSSARRID